MGTFYVVWNEQNRPPMVKHESPETAEAEAERLSLKHAGQTFHVLKCIGSCRKNVVDWFFKLP